MTREEYIDALLDNSPPLRPEARARLEVLLGAVGEPAETTPPSRLTGRRHVRARPAVADVGMAQAS